MVDREIRKITLLSEARSSGLAEGGAVVAYVLLRNPVLLEDFAEAQDGVESALGALNEMSDLTTEERAPIEQLFVNHSELTRIYDLLLSAIESGDLAGVATIIAEEDVEETARAFFFGLERTTDEAEQQLLSTQQNDRGLFTQLGPHDARGG